MTEAGSPTSYTADHVIEYDYKRSVGPVLGAFFTGLRDRRLVGNRTAAGRVLVPPTEADPETGDAMAMIRANAGGPYGSAVLKVKP